MSDDGPVLNEDTTGADDFETVVSDGRIDEQPVPIDTKQEAQPPAEKRDLAVPEWAKPPRAPTPDASKAGAELSAEDKEKASNAGRTLAARKLSIQEEINAETRRKHDTKREADAEAARLAQIRADIAAAQRPDARPPEREAKPADNARQPKPKLENFDNFEEFSEALADWAETEAVRSARALIAEERTAYETRQQQTAQEREQQQLLTAHADRVDKFRAEHHDYDTLLAAAASLPTNAMMEAHFVNSDSGPALMHYLASHPDECTRIASLPPGPTLVALGRLESRLDAAPSGPAVQAPARTFARPPIKPVGSGPVGVSGEPPGAEASLDEHADYYDRQERARRSR